MFMLLKEHRYRAQIGSETRVLRVEELVSGSPVWMEKFRLQIPAETGHEAKTFYGPGAQEVAELGADFLDRRRDK